VYQVARLVRPDTFHIPSIPVVDVPMAYNPTFVTLSSLKPFFFNGLQNE
jgi:hypothetical protein